MDGPDFPRWSGEPSGRASGGPERAVLVALAAWFALVALRHGLYYGDAWLRAGGLGSPAPRGIEAGLAAVEAAVAIVASAAALAAWRGQRWAWPALQAACAAAATVALAKAVSADWGRLGEQFREGAWLWLWWRGVVWAQAAFVPLLGWWFSAASGRERRT